MNTFLHKFLLFKLLLFSATVLAAETQRDNDKDLQQVYQLQYIEREQGVDEYETVMLVSDRYLRIDEAGEDSGYIIYDDNDRVIFSISHLDQSVLVIKQHAFKEKNSPARHEVEYLELADAPAISGHKVFNYRVFTGGGDDETCTEIQLVENLLPEVTKLLKHYQMTVSGQQVKMTDNKITDMQPPCYFVDQIYNTGAYYDKGLPIQEWHSNESSKILTSYKKVSVNRDRFTVPENYRRYSIDSETKTVID